MNQIRQFLWWRYLAKVPAFILLSFLVHTTSPAQIMPKSMEGDVKESARPQATITRKVTKTTPVESRKGILIILTDPPDAEISINGKVEGKATDGQFKKELLLRQHYQVRVSAGDEFSIHEETFAFDRDRSKVIRAPLLSKFALLRIAPEVENAKLFINDVEVEKNRIHKEKDNGAIVVDGLVPGDYKIRYYHPDFIPLERQLKVAPSKEYLIAFTPTPATTEINVKTDSGVTVYVDHEEIGQTPPDGILRKEVRLGSHVIRLYKDGFEEYKESRQFDFGTPVQIVKTLTPLPASAPFREFFDSANKLWDMPRGASIKSGALYLENCTNLVSPIDLRYFDFTMAFHLTLEDEGGAAWAVRVKNKEDYYLFYLSGPRGAFQNQFNTYVVHNNRIDLTAPISTAKIPIPLKAKGQYDISIEFIGNKVKHKIRPAETGKEITLDYFEFRQDVFRSGNVGFRNVQGEKFSVDDIVIEPLAEKGQRN